MRKSVAESDSSVVQKIIEGCSSLLLMVGAAVFLLGDKFLHEIKHVGFWASEGAGIVAGILLMLSGAGIALLGKSPKPKRH
jgi:hypothetical protein